MSSFGPLAQVLVSGDKTRSCWDDLTEPHSTLSNFFPNALVDTIEVSLALFQELPRAGFHELCGVYSHSGSLKSHVAHTFTGACREEHIQALLGVYTTP